LYTPKTKPVESPPLALVTPLINVIYLLTVLNDVSIIQICFF